VCISLIIVSLSVCVCLCVCVSLCDSHSVSEGMVRQWQELFYGGRYSYSDLRAGNPDFVKLADSYGAIGMRAVRPEEVVPLLEVAMKVNDKPVVMDFMVAEEENVFPMVPAGASLLEMVDTED